jgi:hypothetical protein
MSAGRVIVVPSAAVAWTRSRPGVPAAALWRRASAVPAVSAGTRPGKNSAAVADLSDRVGRLAPRLAAATSVDAGSYRL